MNNKKNKLKRVFLYLQREEKNEHVGLYLTFLAQEISWENNKNGNKYNKKSHWLQVFASKLQRD